MAVSLQRRAFTADEFERMAEAGILGEDERVELLDGEIVAMNPIGPSHAWRVNDLAETFAPLRDRVIIAVQNPVRVHEHWTPQPDIALIDRGTPRGRHPRPENVLLIVEVADSSLAVDRDVKTPQYGIAGIPETWVLDMAAERLLVHRAPSPLGYATTLTFERGDRVQPLFAPDFDVDVDAILGPALRSDEDSTHPDSR